MTTAVLIKSLRQKSGLTQRQLADKIGAFPNKISDYENGKHSISLDKFFEICRILNIEPKTLL